jgi:predicted 3-demethylubiquinone-9 3-methyltransferase (glyoxalase superfamily)
MPRTVPCLWFDGRAEEAAELYTSLFPDSKIVSVSRYGPDMPLPEGTVLTVDFTLDGQPYLALNGGPEYRFTPAISFQIHCSDQAEVDHYWEGLTSGGGRPDQCGWLVDRFGVSWQVVPVALTELMQDPDPGRARRATQAMMRMTKIEIAELYRAADADG